VNKPLASRPEVVLCPAKKIIESLLRGLEAGCEWWNRGIAPAGYIKGMALVYARVYVKLKAGEAAALDMAKANTRDVANDALAHYADIFAGTGMSNSVPSADALRHLFVLLIGLGMRMGAGRYRQERDISAAATNAETTPAGLFGTAKPSSMHHRISTRRSAASWRPSTRIWGTEIAEKVNAWAKALTGPTSLPGKYPQLINPPGSETGPG
jgi:hypothetical protein